MRVLSIAALLATSLGLAACADMRDDVAVAPAPPAWPGVIVGSVAADRNGDGIVDGYYTSDGTFVAYQAPPCPAPAPMMQPAPAPSGERG